VIEVKAFGLSAHGNDLWLETRQVDVTHTNGRFHLYVVDNVRQGNPPLSDSLTFTATCWPASSNGHGHTAA